MNSLFKDLKITDWINTVFAIIGVVFGIWVIMQNTQTIKTGQETFLAATSPTLDISYPEIGGRTEFIIRNSNEFRIKDVEVYFVIYLSKENDELFWRVQPNAVKTVSILDGGKDIKLSKEDLLAVKKQFPPEIILQTKGFPTVALVTVFRRQFDNKRFVNIDLFSYTILNNTVAIAPMYANKASAHIGQFSKIDIKQIQEIESAEKVFFRAD